MKASTVTLIPVTGMPLVEVGDDLLKLITEALQFSREALKSGDILVLAQKIVSKAEGAMVNLMSCRVSRRARQLAQCCGKDARLVELILRQSKRIVRRKEGVIISEHKSGCICANAGIDDSNVPGDYVTFLPQDADMTARRMRMS